MSEYDEILDVQENYSTPTNYAGFLQRFVAYILDALILTIPTFAIMYLTMGSLMLDPDPEMMEETMSGIGFFYLIIFVIQWLYFAYFESSANQATPGKMALGLKVTDLEGHRITFMNATGRYFSKIISGIILLIGYIMAAFTEKKQALHDIIAKTLVLKK